MPRAEHSTPSANSPFRHDQPFRYTALMNVTLRKFGYPGSLVKEYPHWCLLLRTQQVTLASLVLAAKSDATAFSALPHEAFTELGDVVKDAEAGLSAFARYDKINYLMLMMVDPHVHMHVIPRYAEMKEFAGTGFPDSGWPGPPDLKSAITLAPEQQEALRKAVRQSLAGGH